jgi:hypothetical protein
MSGARSISLRANEPPMQLPKKKADAEMVHQPQVVVSERVPRVIDRDRPRGFAA